MQPWWKWNQPCSSFSLNSLLSLEDGSTTTAREYKFGVDPKTESVSVVLSDLRACTYDLCVAPLTNPQLPYCPGGTQSLVIGKYHFCFFPPFFN